MTTGILKISKQNFSIRNKFILASVFTSWGGLSIHMQTMSIISKSDLSIKKYVSTKSFRALIALMYAIITFPFRCILYIAK